MKIVDYESASELLKLLGHPARLCILIGILEKDNIGCNVTYMQSCLNIPQSTVSQHLAKLKAANIIKGERNGLEIQYHVINDDVIQILRSINLIQ